MVSASRRALDPGLAVAGLLVDEPLLSEWAAFEALRSLGAGLHAVDRPGRLVTLARGLHAEAMVRGAEVVLGDAIDEVWVCRPGRSSGSGCDVAALRRECVSLGVTDRLLLLWGPDPVVALGEDSVAAWGDDTPSLDQLGRWAEPAQVVCLAHHAAAVSDSSAPGVEVRSFGAPGGAVSAATAAARRLGFHTFMLSGSLQGDPATVGTALGRVGLAMMDGWGGVKLPACGMAIGHFGPAMDRCDQVVTAADAVVQGHAEVKVECWSPGGGSPDLCAVVVSGPAPA